MAAGDARLAAALKKALRHVKTGRARSWAGLQRLMPGIPGLPPMDYLDRWDSMIDFPRRAGRSDCPAVPTSTCAPGSAVAPHDPFIAKESRARYGSAG